MEVYWIKRINWMDQTVSNFLCFTLSRERTKHPVPDDQNSGIVLINTVRIPAMMDSMVTSRIQNIFQWTDVINQLTNKNTDHIAESSHSDIEKIKLLQYESRIDREALDACAPYRLMVLQRVPVEDKRTLKILEYTMNINLKR